MGLNIKNERVHQLAREAARVTGKTQTGVIEEALERLLAERSGPDAEVERRVERIMALAGTMAQSGDTADAIRSVDDLYDESGLPA